MADHLDLLLPIVADHRAKVRVFPLRVDRVLVMDSLWIFLLHPQLEKEGLTDTILFIHRCREVDQVGYLLLPPLVPVGTHHEGLLGELVRVLGQSRGHLVPFLGCLLRVEQAHLLARVATCKQFLRALRVFILVQEAGLFVKFIFYAREQQLLFLLICLG